jgi:hypothetical protein
MAEIVFKLLFALMFAWAYSSSSTSPFSRLALPRPCPAVWRLRPVSPGFSGRIWLHDLLLLVALVGAGSVFGYAFSAVDVHVLHADNRPLRLPGRPLRLHGLDGRQAVETTSLPAFVFPKQARDWGSGWRPSGSTSKKTGLRGTGFSILGGGDIGFPLMLAVAVFFQYG